MSRLACQIKQTNQWKTIPPNPGTPLFDYVLFGIVSNSYTLFFYEMRCNFFKSMLIVDLATPTLSDANNQLKINDSRLASK